MMPKGKLKDLKITPEQEKLYREWFHGEREGTQVGKGGPIVVGPKRKKESKLKPRHHSAPDGSFIDKRRGL